MSDSNSPNLGVELLRIHAIITRGLRVAIDHAQSFAAQGFPSTKMREGFISYVGSLLSVLDAHHNVEDQLAFPYFRGPFPDAPFDLLTAQHQIMLPLLDQLKNTVAGMAADPQGDAIPDELVLLLKKLDEFWHTHIHIEEENFTVDRLAAAISVEEQIRLINMFMEHSQQHAKPDFLVVPFLLYNLSPENRAAFAKAMPPVVTEQLVPVVWKEKWEAMQPFLLA
jgi:hypothetical protein